MTSGRRRWGLTHSFTLFYDGKSGTNSIVSAIVLCVLLTPALGISQPGKIILAWNDQTLETVRTGLDTPVAARMYAMVNIAMYDAVNGIDVANGNSKRDYALISPSGAPINGIPEAAAAAAAHAVLSALNPAMTAIYNAQLAADLKAIDCDEPKPVKLGVDWGKWVGGEVVALRVDDGSSPQETQPGGTDPGEFHADFTSAQYRHMTPFAIADKAPYLSSGPPALSSREYLAAHHEVRLLGDASYVNQDYEEIFRFWRGGSGSARPPGEWVKIAITVAQDRKTTSSLSDMARLFALLGMPQGDATITAWDSKYTYHAWRPTTAIQNASTDGNPDTVEDAAWVPRNGSVGGSPEHTSGQSTYAGAGATILAGFYCNENIAFTFEGDDAIAGSRTFPSFSDAAREAGRARIFAGIHFEFSNQAGQAAGRGVAREILTTALRRSGGPFDPALDCAP
jgi:hypothetical protein